MKVAENTEVDPVYAEPKDEGDIQMEYSFAWFYASSLGSIKKMSFRT
jgi:hypothetical protein